MWLQKIGAEIQYHLLASLYWRDLILAPEQIYSVLLATADKLNSDLSYGFRGVYGSIDAIPTLFL